MKINEIRQSKFIRILDVPLCLLITFLQFFCVEMSYSTTEVWAEIPFTSKLVGAATILFLSVLLMLICKNVRTALNISIALTTILAIANYYVSAFRGTPFTFAQLQNFNTAMNVISSYTFTLDEQVMIILRSTAVQLILANLFYYKANLPRRFSVFAVAAMCVAMYFSYYSAAPAIPKNVVGWSWKDSVRNYGYLPCLIKCTIESSTSVHQPEGYDEAEVRQFIENYEVKNKGGNTPDLIFILNETFFDLQQALPVETDVDPLEYIHSLDNSLQGYCVVPCSGGGTNVSEYEYLTSNSIYLSPNSNPFNTIDIMNANCFSTHLETLGYNSFAAHSEPGLNYARDVAYPALGFDTIHFAEDFTDQEYYADRQYESDESLYKNLFRFYEEMGDEPRVMYLLTIQNHANFDYLKESDYLVHVNNDLGELTNQVNEFLTCMRLSDQAFRSLIEYYENVDRDVIICMLGDHAPIFINDLVDSEYSSEEAQLRTRGVPYVIWSNNIDLSEAELPEWISLPYMVPKVLQLGGVELSPYYDYLAQMADEIPIFTSYGSYVTADGQLFKFEDENEYKEIIDRYYSLAYANMMKAGFMMDQP